MKKSKLITLVSVLLVVTAVSSYFVGYNIANNSNKNPEPTDVNTEYNNAVTDAMVAEKSELHNLVTLDKDSEMVTWNDDKVLLLTLNKYPDSYPKGETVELSYGNVWTFTDKEILEWYKDEKKEKITDYQLRLNQLIGLPPTDDKTHFSALWVDIDDIERPAYYQDVQSTTMDILNNDMDKGFKSWFDANIISSYYEEYKYPWTRLGYTYDWAEDSDEYGLTEFLIKENSEVTVEYTKTTKEFIEYMDKVIQNT